MKLNNIEEVGAFLATVDSCKGNVYLRSPMCDIYNLKSSLSQYTAVGALLSEHGDELELFCEEQCDEQLFFKYFEDYPGTLGDGE